MKITPNNITKLKKNEVFVFGSNLNGAHIGGAAKLALDKFGAVNGQPAGLQGKSYAVPTLDQKMFKQNIWDIQEHVKDLLHFITTHPTLHFYVTEIGCGIAGFTHAEIAPLFKEFISIENISLPQKFVDLLSKKGYKVTDKNMACRGYKYALNKIYVHTGTVSPCNSGFHYCPELVDCFGYYDFSTSNRVFEIIDHGNTVTDGNKNCTSQIELIRELPWLEVLELCNMGKGNSGLSNAGNDNAGSRNAGNYNAGSRNAGYSNAGNDNAGAFNNLEKPAYILFNRPSKWTYDDFINSEAYRYLSQVETTLWVPDYKMTEEEKKEFPYYVTTSGYSKTIPYKEAFANSWNNWNEAARLSFQKLPNFDRLIFLSITGIDVDANK